MNTSAAIVMAVVIVSAMALAVWWNVRRGSTAPPCAHFGPQNDRTLERYGGEGPAQDTPECRARRFEQLRIKRLSSADNSRYTSEWREVQTLFDDDPQVAIGEADRLVGEVMRAQGYPISDLDQRAADVSADHPGVVEHYRVAHTIARETAVGEADGDELSQAIVHYRALFDELIATPQPVHQEAHR
jgi:hypothetical protein